MSRFVLALVPLLALAATANAQQRKSAKIDLFGADEAKVYKTVGNVKLLVRIYRPKKTEAGRKHAAIVFFFGGGWRSGTPRQFSKQARYFADRGMVAFTADYRVWSRHKAKVVDCVADAQDAIRWVRAHAEELGIDPERIAAAGGSAGGHLAAATATLPDHDADAKVSCRPNALLLFNPALDLRPEAFNTVATSQRYRSLQERFGAKAEELSPTLHIRKGTPPTIIFHGTADKTVPFAQAEAFAARMKKLGNRCELASYEGQGHGFFNFGRGGNRYFLATVERADRFLASLGFLQGTPTIRQRFKAN